MLKDAPPTESFDELVEFEEFVARRYRRLGIVLEAKDCQLAQSKRLLLSIQPKIPKKVNFWSLKLIIRFWVRVSHLG